jgi:hypothetical protein
MLLLTSLLLLLVLVVLLVGTVGRLRCCCCCCCIVDERLGLAGSEGRGSGGPLPVGDVRQHLALFACVGCRALRKCERRWCSPLVWARIRGQCQFITGRWSDQNTLSFAKHVFQIKKAFPNFTTKSGQRRFSTAKLQIEDEIIYCNFSIIMILLDGR